MASQSFTLSPNGPGPNCPPSEYGFLLRQCTDILRLHSLPPEDTLVLPDERQRWPRVLHWLGWAGKVMPIERWAEYKGMEMPFDSWDESRFGSRPQSFHSIIDNLFLRSAAALEWMIDRIADGDSIAKTTSPRPDARRPNGGRPADTNEAEDRRIADAWKTKRFKSLSDLAMTFGKTKPEIRKRSTATDTALEKPRVESCVKIAELFHH